MLTLVASYKEKGSKNNMTDTTSTKDKLNKNIINKEIKPSYDYEKVSGENLTILKMIVDKDVKVLINDKDVVSRMGINKGKVLIQVNDNLELDGNVYTLSFTYNQFDYKATVHAKVKDNRLSIEAINNLHRRYRSEFIHCPKQLVALNLSGEIVLGNVLEMSSHHLLINVRSTHSDTVLNDIDKVIVGVLNADNERNNVRFVGEMSVIDDALHNSIALKIDTSFDNEEDFKDFEKYLSEFIESEELRIKEEYLVNSLF